MIREAQTTFGSITDGEVLKEVSESQKGTQYLHGKKTSFFSVQGTVDILWTCILP